MWILSIILFIIGAALLFTALKLSEKMGKTIVRSVGVGITMLALVALVFSCFTQVPAKKVGVVTAFGKVSEDSLSSGLSLKAPWQKVTEIDATRQTDEYTAESIIEVRIGDGSNAYVEETIRWEINPEYASAVYQDFRSDDPTQSFKHGVITTQLKAATQKVLADYNPISELKTIEGTDSADAPNFAPDYDATATAIYDEMEARLGDEPLANIISVTVSYVGLSDTTQGKLNDYVAAIGDTRIAQQKAVTADAQADANNKLSNSVSKDPNVLVSKCFDLVADSIKSGYQLPAGFSCWNSSSNGLVLGQNNPQPKE